MGKNTVIQQATLEHLGNNPALEKLLSHLQSNGYPVFTKEDFPNLSHIALANRVPADSHAGAVIPWEVTVPAEHWSRA